MMHDHVVVPVAYSQRQKFGVIMCTKFVLKVVLVIAAVFDQCRAENKRRHSYTIDKAFVF